MVTRKTTTVGTTLTDDLTALNDHVLQTLQLAIQKQIDARAQVARKAKEQQISVVNTRLAEIKTELNKLESEIEKLVNSVDSEVGYVSFSHTFGDSSTATYNNSDKYWSSSSY